jgi:hypothetical protein
LKIGIGKRYGKGYKQKKAGKGKEKPKLTDGCLVDHVG